MSRTGFKYTLWRDRPLWRGGGSVAVTTDAHVSLDLQDEADVLRVLADIIGTNGGKLAGAGQYTAEVTDLATGEITRITRSVAELEAAGDGRAVLSGGTPSLQDVTDDALMAELRRRLRVR